MTNHALFRSFTFIKINTVTFVNSFIEIINILGTNSHLNKIVDNTLHFV